MRFIREDRYFVLKRRDMEAALDYSEITSLSRMAAKVHAYRDATGKKDFECVVVESDWPEYEPTWESIQKRMATK